jgi:integrase
MSDLDVTDELVFLSAAGTPQDRNRVRSVLGKSIKRANENLAEAKLAAMPDGLTLHALRRTFASVLFALGKDAPYVMAQMGHMDPTVTLGLYAKVMAVSDADRERLRVLVDGVESSVLPPVEGVASSPAEGVSDPAAAEPVSRARAARPQ